MGGLLNLFTFLGLVIVLVQIGETVFLLRILDIDDPKIAQKLTFFGY